MVRDHAFEWDENKRLANFAKHGIDFVMVRSAFDDKRAIAWTDHRRDYGERRQILVGSSDGPMVTVVYTLRRDTIRLISARRSNLKERTLYEQQ